MDVARLVELGVFDPDAPDAAEHLSLIEQVVALGASDAELVDAARTQRLGDLALELAMRPPGQPLGFEEAAGEAGLETERAARFWRAAGFADPEVAPPRLTPDEVDGFRLMALADGLFGADAALAMVRVMGSLTARLAEAVVDAFRTEVEVPQQTAGVPYPEIVRNFVGVTTETLPMFGESVSSLFRRHLMIAAAGAWSVDEEATHLRRDLTVGFVDIVGYTAYSGTVTSSSLASLVTRLEDAASDLAARHQCRVVKLIGDGAMFASERAVDACELALNLVDQFAADPEDPPLRASLAGGPVVSVHGDYFGPVVNTAARLLAVAGPSEVVVDDSLSGLVGNAFRLEPLPSRPLKGLPTPEHLYRLRRGSEGPSREP